jgi:hypothetical protein
MNSVWCHSFTIILNSTAMLFLRSSLQAGHENGQLLGVMVRRRSCDTLGRAGGGGGGAEQGLEQARAE